MLLDLVRTEDNTDDDRVFMIRNAYENPVFPIILIERLALSAAGVARRTGTGAVGVYYADILGQAVCTPRGCSRSNLDPRVAQYRCNLL
jgi:hypothetical protein